MEPTSNNNLNPRWKMGLAVIVTAVVIGGGAYWYANNKAENDKVALQATIDGLNNNVTLLNKKISDLTPTTTATPITADPTEGWKTFKSNEGFTLKYPPDWVLTPGNGSLDVPPLETADLRSPDGLFIRYTGPGSGALAISTDSFSCGQQSVCSIQNVLSVDTLKVPNHGSVELVKSLPETISSPEIPTVTDINCFKMDLHEPSGPTTTPKVGTNTYKDHDVFYSLLSKSKVRFSLGISDYWVPSTTSGPVYTFKCAGLTPAQFFSKTSVQQAETILRSLSY